MERPAERAVDLAGLRLGLGALVPHARLQHHVRHVGGSGERAQVRIALRPGEVEAIAQERDARQRAVGLRGRRLDPLDPVERPLALLAGRHELTGIGGPRDELLDQRALAVGELPVHAQVAGLEPGGGELRRQLDVIAQEVEKLRSGEPEIEITDQKAKNLGLGSSAASVYRKRQGVSVAGYGEMTYENFADRNESGSEGGRGSQLDFLRAVSEEQVTLCFRDPQSAAEVRPAGESGYQYRYVVMPMRI